MDYVSQAYARAEEEEQILEEQEEQFEELVNTEENTEPDGEPLVEPQNHFRKVAKVLVIFLVLAGLAQAQRAGKSTISAKYTPMYGLSGVEWVVNVPLPLCGRYGTTDKFKVEAYNVRGIDGGESIQLVCSKEK